MRIGNSRGAEFNYTADGTKRSAPAGTNAASQLQDSYGSSGGRQSLNAIGPSHLPVVGEPPPTAPDPAGAEDGPEASSNPEDSDHIREVRENAERARASAEADARSRRSNGKPKPVDFASFDQKTDQMNDMLSAAVKNMNDANRAATGSGKDL